MAEPRKNDGWLLALYGLMVVIGTAMLCIGVVEWVRGNGPVLVGAGVLALIVPAAVYPLMMIIKQQVQAGQTRAKEFTDLLRSINDRLLVSDAAKRIAYREQDRDALRQAILEDINRRDYDAAMVLVVEMARQYGYRQEAEEFRERILAARKVEEDARIGKAITELERVIGRQEWEAAFAEVAKLQRLFPESTEVRGLTKKVKTAREEHKKSLEKRFFQAAEREEIDLAMELIKELDKYLSETEAEPFREAARNVIGKKRQNLGVQFKLAINDKEWTSAVRIGEQIMNEFPNSKMSDEVRSMIDLLRDRAAGQEASPQT